MKAMYDYWRDFPPANELQTLAMGYQRELTTEEKWDQGAMNPAEMSRHFKRTRGKLPH